MIKRVKKIENQGENWYKMVKWQTLGQIISGTKCNRDKLIFSGERWGQYD